jgi:hypothetical protein
MHMLVEERRFAPLGKTRRPCLDAPPSSCPCTTFRPHSYPRILLRPMPPLVALTTFLSCDILENKGVDDGWVPGCRGHTTPRVVRVPWCACNRGFGPGCGSRLNTWLTKFLLGRSHGVDYDRLTGVLHMLIEIPVPACCLNWSGRGVHMLLLPEPCLLPWRYHL